MVFLFVDLSILLPYNMTWKIPVVCELLICFLNLRAQNQFTAFIVMARSVMIFVRDAQSNVGDDHCVCFHPSI